MKKILTFSILLLAFAAIPNAFPDITEKEWTDITANIDEPNLNTAAVDCDNNNIIYAGSAKSIFKSADAGKNWQKLYIVRGTNTVVNTICLDPKDPNIAYAGTQNGIFKTTNGGITWNKTFGGIGNQEKEIRHIAIDAFNPARIYAGTASGLFVSNDSGKMWNKSTGEIGNEKINYIAINPSDVNIIYLAANTGIFKSQNGAVTWERILSVKAQTDEAETEEIPVDSNADDSATFSNRTPNCIAIDSQDASRIYIGTNSGVLISDNSGEIFNKITGVGLTNKNISSLLILDNGILYAATGSGIFKISKPYARWGETYAGLRSKEMRYLVYGKKNNSMLAVAKRGLYSTRLSPNPGPEDSSPQPDSEIERLLAKFKHEPSVQEVQKAAIRYAEVNKEKIEEWRRSARRKALLPTLSVGVDHGVKNTSEIYTSATRSYWEIGPDDKSTGWDVTVRWDLGELIWNDDQTNIDVRSRLMVQLRDDILNEVTRLYFERRKLQIDLLMNPPKNIQARLEKELRLLELTAGIDALTGGWFSKKLSTG